MVADNVSLGSFNLTEIPPAPRGVPQINVKFDIDANGIINVTAKDLGTGKDAKITIESSSKMSEEDVEKMKTDAEKFAEEDKKKKETVDIKNEAESFIYTTEKLVNQDLKDKIPQEKGIKITDAIKDLKESLTQGTEQIKPKLDALKAIVNEVTTELYKNTAPPNGEQESSQEKESTGDQNTGEEKTDSENNQEQKTDQDSEQKSENS
jgi:molecular chaperone DnaK